ncbi:hypothetical protein INO08_15740, partial [Staphylococcus aureus]|nr:hypothetical protein [Staphylococcus aureus]
SDGMILDEGQNDSSGHKENTFSDFDEDQASLSLSMRDFDGETEADTAMTDGENLTREQIEVEIRKIKDAHAEDEEFPDEVDTPLDVP